MKKKQWFVFAVLFLFTAVYFQYLGFDVGSESEDMMNDNLRELMKVEEDGTWTETFGISYLSTQGYANTLFIVSNTSYAFSNLSWGIFIACMICGFLEKKKTESK